MKQNIMKQITIILFLFFSLSIKAQTFTNQELNGNIDLESNTLTVNLKETLFSGILASIKYKYKNYYIIKGENNHLLISFENLKSKRETKISEIFILDGEYDQLVKEIEKNRLKDSSISFKYNYMFDASKNKDLNSTWINIEHLDNQNKLKEEYNNVTKLSDFIGKYYVKILRSDGLDYSELEYKAELYITGIGFTFKSEIPSIMLLRGTHYMKEEFLPTKEGSFILTKGGSTSKLVSLSVNSEKKGGAFSFNEYGKTSTTTFIIEKFVN
jgi:hypothetical protein